MMFLPDMEEVVTVAALRLLGDLTEQAKAKLDATPKLNRAQRRAADKGRRRITERRYGRPATNSLRDLPDKIVGTGRSAIR